tara:strand:- start:906 stop:1139 length:234 start_codon:yes stop_codon:yes gene_type:complete
MNDKENLLKEISLILNLDSKEKINERYNLKNDIGWDSLSIVRTVVSVEKIYNVILSDKEVSSCVTIKDLFNIINKKL